MSAQPESQPNAGLDVRRVHRVEMKPGFSHSKFDLLKELPVDPSQIIQDFPSVRYNYQFHGAFNSKEVENLRKNAKVLSVNPICWGIPLSGHRLFRGLTNQRGRLLVESDFGSEESNSGSDVIIGDIDTGISPKYHSFSDLNMGPIPCCWKGECQNGTGFSPSNCDKKLIGARFSSQGDAIKQAVPSNSSDHLQILSGSITKPRARARARLSARVIAKQIKKVQDELVQDVA